MKTLPLSLRDRRPIACGLRVKGKQFRRWPVAVVVGAGIFNPDVEVVVEVIAVDAQDAAHHVKDTLLTVLDRPFGVVVVGVRGGVAAHLYAGYESLIGARMWKAREPRTQEFNFIEV